MNIMGLFDFLKSKRTKKVLIVEDDKFLSELGWREFCRHLLYDLPDLAERNLHGRVVKNKEALANPEALALYQGIAEDRRMEALTVSEALARMEPTPLGHIGHVQRDHQRAAEFESDACVTGHQRPAEPEDHECSDCGSFCNACGDDICTDSGEFIRKDLGGDTPYYCSNGCVISDMARAEESQEVA